MSDLFDLSGKVAVITGSTKGIGMGIAKRFAEHGARVVISSRNQADCDEVARGINDQMGSEVAMPVAADLADPTSLQHLVDATVERWGALDVLVLNAAKTDVLGTAAVTAPDDFSAMLTVNVVNNSILAHAAFPHLKKKGGSIIAISSITGTGPSSSTAAYGIGKRAIHQMVDNLAAEWSAFNIRVNIVAPGFTVSESTRPIIEAPERREAIIAGIPLGRLGEPDDMAACAVFLASPGGSFVTAQTIVIDGGSTLRGAARPSTQRPVDVTGIVNAARAAASS